MVIPANAGVFLNYSCVTSTIISYPRECGGDPITTDKGFEKFLLSPRMRG